MRWLLSLFGMSVWPFYVAVALAVSGAIAGAYIKGRLDAGALCRAAELKAEIVALRRDIAMAQAAEMVEDRLMADLKIQAEQDQKRIEDYEKDLAARPDTRCALTDDDVRRLR